MCLYGTTRSYFEEAKTGPIASWVIPEEIEEHDQIFDPKKGGYGPPLNWYKAQIANLNTPDEVELPKDHLHIQQPTLLVAAKLDAVAVPVMQEGGMRPFVKDLTVKEIDSGHWVQADKAEEFNKTLEAFLN